jgi:NADPH-dependent ferric siderophore reductase
MTATLDTPAALLAELIARGIELQAHGDRLRFRPQKAMTGNLVARDKAHKPALLALLADVRDAVERIKRVSPAA